AFEGGQPLLEHRHRGVAVAAVDVDVVLALEGGLGLGGVVEDVAGIEEDRLARLVVLRAGEAGADEPRRQAPVLRVGAHARTVRGLRAAGLRPSWAGSTMAWPTMRRSPSMTMTGLP